MTFLLHHTQENRVGLCHEDDGADLGENSIIARLSFEQTVGLYDDIHESFQSCVERGWIKHPDDGGEDEPD